jgi:hypothetical protein
VRAVDNASKLRNRDAINARKRTCRAANPEATKAERKRSYAARRDVEILKMREYKAANNARIRAQARERYHTDIDAARTRQNAYLDANRGKARAWRMKRIAQQLSATPRWADMRAIEMIYAVAARVSSCMGIPHEVDHVVPLQGAIGRRRVVSGLHVEYNLRVVSRSANRMKSNQL